MMRQVTWMSRTFSTSSTVRDVIQANGQRGSNQKSTVVMKTATRPAGRYSRERSVFRSSRGIRGDGRRDPGSSGHLRRGFGHPANEKCLELGAVDRLRQVRVH